jgi:L-lactate dehydrogenase
MSRISIVGTGAVGTAAAGAILQERLATSIRFFDKADAKAEGEAMDFAHAAALLGDVKITSAPFEEASGEEVCVLSAGVKQRKGETRLALLERNIEAATSIAETLERNGLPRVLIVLTNPVDVMTEFFVRRWAGRGVSVIGSGTALDSMRLRHAIATRLGVAPSIVHAWVVGEHGDSSVSLFQEARVGCFSLEEYATQSGIALPNEAFDAIEREVRTAAYAVIERKGATAHAIGLTAARLVRAILRDEHVLVPVSTRVEDGLCASLPCLLGASGAGRPLRPSMAKDEAARFQKSLDILREATRVLGR